MAEMKPRHTAIVKEALTFDDVLLVPGHSLVHPKDTAVSSRLTRGIGHGHGHRGPDGHCRGP